MNTTTNWLKGLFVILAFSFSISSYAHIFNNIDDDCLDIINLAIPLDDHADEISWTLVKIDDVQAVTEGEYFSEMDNFSTAESSICLTEGCYELTIFDDWGDGLRFKNKQKLIASTDSGLTLIESDGKFKDYINVQFCVDEKGAILK